MKFAIISDIHSNYPALEAVHTDVKNEIDSYICVGDILGLLGYPEECTQFVKNNASYAILGNHDYALLNFKSGWVNSEELSDFELDITYEQLSEDSISYLSGLDTYCEIPDLKVLVAHAEPTTETAILSNDMVTKREVPRSSGLVGSGISKGDYVTVAANTDGYDFVLLGHTHQQGALDCSNFGHNTTVLNPGSVGQNIDEKAEYAVIDTTNNTFELRSVEYDSKRTKSKLHDLEVPTTWW